MQGMQETWVRSLGREDPWDKGMATDSDTLGWRIPWGHVMASFICDKSVIHQRMTQDEHTSLHPSIKVLFQAVGPCQENHCLSRNAPEGLRLRTTEGECIPEPRTFRDRETQSSDGVAGPQPLLATSCQAVGEQAGAGRTRSCLGSAGRNMASEGLPSD